MYRLNPLSRSLAIATNATFATQAAEVATVAVARRTERQGKIGFETETDQCSCRLAT
jgi:hypothetical protein